MSLLSLIGIWIKVDIYIAKLSKSLQIILSFIYAQNVLKGAKLMPFQLTCRTPHPIPLQTIWIQLFFFNQTMTFWFYLRCWYHWYHKIEQHVTKANLHIQQCQITECWNKIAQGIPPIIKKTYQHIFSSFISDLQLTCIGMW